MQMDYRLWLIFSGIILVFGAVILCRYSPWREEATGNEAYELAALQETGECRVWQASATASTTAGDPLTLQATLRTQYQDLRRDPFFQQSLATQWGYEPGSHTILQVVLRCGAAPQAMTQPATAPATTMNALPATVPLRAELRTTAGDTLQSLDLAAQTTWRPTAQGEVLRTLHAHPVALTPGLEHMRYMVFSGKVDYESLAAVTLWLGDREWPLQPTTEEYPVPLGLPETFE